jgi:preprotein translocase subunit SecY
MKQFLAFPKSSKTQNNPTEKILFTFFILFLFRLGNTIPLSSIDQEALKKAFLQLENKNAFLQILNIYSGSGISGRTLLSPFSLGIIPYINASILIDLLTTVVPTLEKLQSEEGELGRQKLFFYKKIVTLIFAIFQSGFLIFSLQNYFYNPLLSNFFILGLELVTGSLLIVWLSNLIDTKGLGNGTSLIIFTNIVINLLNKDFFTTANQDPFLGGELLFLSILFILICFSQSARIQIEVVSARQLSYLEKMGKNSFSAKVSKTSQIKDSGLSIRMNQAGIFPIIIASNLLPLLGFLNSFGISYLTTLLYYILVVCFNYFYTLVFWDPEKISEQLRKASVSIVNVTPGKETISYLGNVVKSTSLLGGIFLCLILFFYELIKQISQGALLNQLNISSAIILVGVAYELQKTIQSLYKNIIVSI